MSMTNITEELLKKEKEFHGKPDIFGMTLLTNPGYISSSRNVMFTAHLKQYVNLNEPEIPKLFTNNENLVGKYSTGYKKAKNDMVVHAKVSRFPDGVNDDHLYAIFFYDEKKDKYSMLMKKNVENLTEVFGYEYSYDSLDEAKKGDKIEKDDVLYKTSSYDEDMNFRYGKNTLFMYTLDTRTIEDAIVCSKSFAEAMTSTEVEQVKVPINDNDILINLYGDNENYKPFPDIGEKINNKIICATRRLNNSQLLYDLKYSNLNKVNYTGGDVVYLSEGTIDDIIIYSNKTLDEIPSDNRFYKQIRYYLEMQTKFYGEIYRICKNIIESGSKYSSDIGFYYRKAKDILDPNTKWKEENSSVFSNISIEFLVKRRKALSKGQKITGRYGNKGVISEIVPDEEMPRLEDGRTIHVLFNSLGVVNRLNSYQLYESSINFVSDRVIERIKTFDTLEEKSELLFDFIGKFNKKQREKLEAYYYSLTDIGKEEFFEDIYETGIYIHIPPMWSEEPLFDTLNRIYNVYDWIKPHKVYVYNKKFGRTVPIMRDLYIGSMYIIKLKQSSQKGFSARSTGALNRKGVPEKSTKAKNNLELYSKTPIRIGEQENTNTLIGVPPEIISTLHMFYRSSPKGRRYLGKKLLTELDTLEDFVHQADFKNRNLEILQAYLKSLGLRLEFLNDPYTIDISLGHLRCFRTKKGGLVISTKNEFDMMELKEKIQEMYYSGEKVYIGTPDKFEETIERDFNRFINDNKEMYTININTK